jgi:LPS export ABC transporter permease LptG
VRILSRYYATRFLGFYAGILVVSTLTIVIVEMLLNLDDMLRLQPGAAGMAHYLFLRIPSYYLRELFPITSFAAAFFALALSAQDLEIMAIKTGGISPRRAIAPILLCAGLVAVLSFALGETWILSATRDWNRQRSGSGPDISYRQGSFWYYKGRTIYNISSADPTSDTLQGVRLFELNAQGRLLRSIEGSEVVVGQDDIWRFQSATIRRYSPDAPDSPSLAETVSNFSLPAGQHGTIAMIETDLQSLSVAMLREYIATRLSEAEDVHRIEAVLYARYGEPFLVVLFALLAAPLGLLVEERRGFGAPVLLGIVIVASYFTLRSVTSTLASEGVVPALVATAGLHLLYVGAGVAGLYQIRS